MIDSNRVGYLRPKIGKTAMKRMRNGNKKLELENMGIRKLDISDVEQVGGGTGLRDPGVPADLDTPISWPPPGGFGEEMHC